MNYILKFFNFKDTINGTTYFLRNLLASAIAFLGGFSLGWGIANQNYGLVSLGAVVVAIALAFQYSSLFKRMKSLFPENTVVLTVVVALLQLLAQMVKPYEYLNISVTISLVIIAFILIFKNSGIEKHEG
jgi:urea transporter